MSEMELRSSRSRSRTPFLSEEFIQEKQTMDNQVENSTVRTTRRTTTYVKSNEQLLSSSTDEVNTARETIIAAKQPPNKKKSERSLRSRVLKTSDYSSEDGENEVTSSRTTTIKQQQQQQNFLDDARSLNGRGSGETQMPALDLYKRSGRYWDVYPKTDWTYSPHSKDRREIAPGVVAMPNMSRKTIHNLDEVAFDHSQHLYSDKVSHKNVNTDLSSKYYSASNKDEEFLIKRRSQNVNWTNFKRLIYSVFTSIFIYTYRVQTGLFSYIHRIASYVMLLDTFLLWKTRPVGEKATKLALLCLVPLLILGGIWLFSGIGDAIFSSLILPTQSEDNVIKPTGQAHSLTKAQLEAIAAAVKDSLKLDKIDNTNQLMHQIIHDPNFVNTINNYYQSKNKELFEEIEKLREQVLINTQARHDDMTKMALNFKKCCETEPTTNGGDEAYATKIITDLLNNAEFLKSQPGLNAHLSSLFFAKDELENRLSNISSSMDEKLAALVNHNSEILMEKMTNNFITQMKSGDFSQEAVQKIVKSALKIYDADRTGLVDYAMESMGAEIVTTRCTEPYRFGKGVVSVWGVPLWHRTNTPRTVLTPTMMPGDCWAFQNFPGFILIKLSNPIKVEAISMEHISKLLLPDGSMDSAPREFEVYGLNEENDRDPVLLGTYVYDYNGESLQFFLIEKQQSRPYELIELRILSNHGNPNYTCLYRFRVHGK